MTSVTKMAVFGVASVQLYNGIVLSFVMFKGKTIRSAHNALA